jgi:hypothetical protein
MGARLFWCRVLVGAQLGWGAGYQRAGDAGLKPCIFNDIDRVYFCEVLSARSLREIDGVKTYPNDEIDAACEDALLHDSLSYAAVRSYLINASSAQALNATEESLPKTSSSRFQRDISEYSQMLLNLGTTKGDDAYEH